jgi:hypothetical protein
MGLRITSPAVTTEGSDPVRYRGGDRHGPTIHHEDRVMSGRHCPHERAIVLEDAQVARLSG